MPQPLPFLAVADERRNLPARQDRPSLGTAGKEPGGPARRRAPCPRAGAAETAAARPHRALLAHRALRRAGSGGPSRPFPPAGPRHGGGPFVRARPRLPEPALGRGPGRSTPPRGTPPTGGGGGGAAPPRPARPGPAPPHSPLGHRSRRPPLPRLPGRGGGDTTYRRSNARTCVTR